MCTWYNLQDTEWRAVTDTSLQCVWRTFIFIYYPLSVSRSFFIIYLPRNKVGGRQKEWIHFCLVQNRTKEEFEGKGVTFRCHSDIRLKMIFSFYSYSLNFIPTKQRRPMGQRKEEAQINHITKSPTPPPPRNIKLRSIFGI